jgi:hypothetical protein
MTTTEDRTRGRDRQQRIKRALEHAYCEIAGDEAATLATLEDDPYFEIHPAGLRIQGRAVVERYYAHYFANVRPRYRATTDHGMWENEDGVVFEMSATVEHDDGSLSDHRNIAILGPGETGIAGERLYGDEALARFMFGPVYDEFRPI